MDDMQVSNIIVAHAVSTYAEKLVDIDNEQAFITTIESMLRCSLYDDIVDVLNDRREELIEERRKIANELRKLEGCKESNNVLDEASAGN